MVDSGPSRRIDRAAANDDDPIAELIGTSTPAMFSVKRGAAWPERHWGELRTPRHSLELTSTAFQVGRRANQNIIQLARPPGRGVVDARRAQYQLAEL